VTWFRSDGPLSAGEIADQITDLYLLGLTAREMNVKEQSTSE